MIVKPPPEIEYEDDGYYTAAEKALYEKPKPKPDNTQFIVNWKKGTLLGSGGFGKVYLGLDNETGAMFAVKEISLGGDVYQQSKEVFTYPLSFILLHVNYKYSPSCSSRALSKKWQ